MTHNPFDKHDGQLNLILTHYADIPAYYRVVRDLRATVTIDIVLPMAEVRDVVAHPSFWS